MPRYIDADKIEYEDVTAYPIIIHNITLKQYIDEIPAADVQEVKHEKWEIVDNNNDIWCDLQCTCCREIERFYNGYSKGFKFCPNCGAKMDGDEK